MKKHLLILLIPVLLLACKKSGSNSETVEPITDEWNPLTGGKPLAASLTGEAAVPGPGDNNGSGVLEMSLNIGKRMIIYRLTVASIATPIAAKLHEGAVGKEGPVRITLQAPVNGSVTDTITELDRTLVQKIMKNPENYYVAVSNASYPKGAIRGQIFK